MTIHDTRAAVRQAREIGFSRRELFKYGLLAAGAVTVAACGGGDTTAPVVEKFAVGTWRVKYTKPSGSEAPVDMTFTINSDGTFTSTGGPTTKYTKRSYIASSGTWTFGKGFVQITGEGGVNAMASNVPDTMSDATISWQFDSNRATPANISAATTWDSDSKTLTIMGLDADGRQFPIEATKQ